jgi:RNA polymerase-binding transcription factor DksA
MDIDPKVKAWLSQAKIVPRVVTFANSTDNGGGMGPDKTTYSNWKVSLLEIDPSRNFSDYGQGFCREVCYPGGIMSYQETNRPCLFDTELKDKYVELENQIYNIRNERTTLNTMHLQQKKIDDLYNKQRKLIEEFNTRLPLVHKNQLKNTICEHCHKPVSSARLHVVTDTEKNRKDFVLGRYYCLA